MRPPLLPTINVPSGEQLVITILGPARVYGFRVVALDGTGVVNIEAKKG